MKHYTTKEIPATVEKVHYKTTCELCGKVIRKEAYSIDEVEIKYRKGEIYPEGGFWNDITVDICLTCFTEKLVPWLESQGATFSNEYRSI